MIYFEDLPLGIKTDLGTYTFTEDDIIKFASRWDPQPFHTDPAAAQDSIFGGLVASGWHVCAIWMKLMVANRQRHLEKMKQRVAGGVSPGFRDLKWLAPVRPGDTLHYYSTNTEKVELKSRPAFGILRSHNEAINQDGVSVMTFTGQGFMGRRPKKG
jgi:acyl dehydratase